MANGDNETIKEQRESFRVRGPAGVGGAFIDKQTVKRVDPSYREITTTDITLCNSCQNVIHKVEEAGGVCAVCSLDLCVDCSKHRCELCGRCICIVHTTEIQSKPFCATHGFFEILGFLIFGR